jgi:ribosomal protein L12E/L44/L45/RPP1/RPP2
METMESALTTQNELVPIRLGTILKLFRNDVLGTSLKRMSEIYDGMAVTELTPSTYSGYELGTRFPSEGTALSLIHSTASVLNLLQSFILVLKRLTDIQAFDEDLPGLCEQFETVHPLAMAYYRLTIDKLSDLKMLTTKVGLSQMMLVAEHMYIFYKEVKLKVAREIEGLKSIDEAIDKSIDEFSIEELKPMAGLPVDETMDFEQVKQLAQKKLKEWLETFEELSNYSEAMIEGMAQSFINMESIIASEEYKKGADELLSSEEYFQTLTDLMMGLKNDDPELVAVATQCMPIVNSLKQTDDKDIQILLKPPDLEIMEPLVRNIESEIKNMLLSFFYRERFYQTIAEHFPVRYIGASILANVLVEDLENLVKDPPYPSSYYDNDDKEALRIMDKPFFRWIALDNEDFRLSFAKLLLHENSFVEKRFAGPDLSVAAAEKYFRAEKVREYVPYTNRFKFASDSIFKGLYFECTGPAIDVIMAFSESVTLSTDLKEITVSYRTLKGEILEIKADALWTGNIDKAIKEFEDRKANEPEAASKKKGTAKKGRKKN